MSALKQLTHATNINIEKYDPGNADILLSAIPCSQRMEVVLKHNENFMRTMIMRHAYHLDDFEKDDLFQELFLVAADRLDESLHCTLGEFTRSLYWKWFSMVKTVVSKTMKYRERFTLTDVPDVELTDIVQSFIDIQSSQVAEYVCQQLREKLMTDMRRETFDVILKVFDNDSFFTKTLREECGQEIKASTALERRRYTLDEVKSLIQSAPFKDDLKELLFAHS